jgi:serine phosphatase RsbU (regulator of sigma subunit)
MAQDGSAQWLNATIEKIETGDTVGLEKQLSVPLSSSSGAEYQLRHQIAYCYILLYPEKHQESSVPYEKCLSLDSLVPDDSLHQLVKFIQGYYYFCTFNYSIALEFLNQASLEWNNKAETMQQARCFMVRSNILQDLSYPEEAEKCMLIALEYYKREGYPRKESAVYNNIGLLRNYMGDSTGAFAYMKKSIALRDSIGDIYGLGQCYNNMGTIYLKLGHYDTALYYFNRGLDFRLRANAPVTGLIESRINIGRTLYQVGRTQESLDTLEKCLRETQTEHHTELKRRIADHLRTIYASIGKYDRAYEMQELYYTLQDTLYNRSLKEDILRRTVEYDFRNREREEQIRQQERETRSNIIMIALGMGLLLAGIFLYSLYRSNQLKKKNNEIISRQRDALDDKQREITESIRYARYIQQTLLPEDSMLTGVLKEHFILYLPKDIVSGDFYWLKQLKNDSVLVAAADCTGHGVPGAFMSLLAKENLDKSAVNSDEPGNILSALNRSVKQALRQDNEIQSGVALRDGLDIALVRLNGRQLAYAGANRPLWIYRAGTKQFEEVKPTKSAIGGMTRDDQHYAESDILLEKGDMIYLFTDGFADQFGGERKKKLTTKKFREQLGSIVHKSPEQQKELLTTFFNQWKKDEAQVDDVLVIGIRIS